MIVRDESAVVERCIASVRDLVDTWVVCDTGSVDDTPARIELAFGDVPGVLHHRPWQDFGHNRTELMVLARGTADYLLLLDADMTVRRREPLPPLEADAYLLRHAGTLDYAVPRLVRGDRAWRFEGATHEHLASDEPFVPELLTALEVVHHADGGSRGDKLTRDRALLEARLAEAPHDPRALFYLAQTYRDLGERELAIDLYRRRVAVGGWDEEVFYAQYQVGLLLVPVDWDRAVPELLRAWDLRPTRAEPLYELARGSRERREYHLARLFAECGLALAPSNDILFVHRDAESWGLRFERAIAAYWTGDVETALRDNDELLARSIPSEIEHWVRHNRDWCLRALGRRGGEAFVVTHRVETVPLLADLAPGTRVDRLVVPAEEGWSLCNPTIGSDGDGFRLVVRSVNYDLSHGEYRVIDADGVVRTRNYLVQADAALVPTDVRVLPMVPDGPPVHRGLVMGCEDCRLVRVGDQWYATATVRDRNPGLVCQMALLHLTGSDVTRMVLIDSPDPSVHEKNWMPFLVDGALHFLYSSSPTVVLACDPSTGSVETVSERSGPAEARGFRGGSQGLPVLGGWIFVIHEAALGPGGQRAYLHRVIRLDARFELVGMSEPFAFVEPGIEFCAGLAERDGVAVLAFGLADRGAYLARVPVEEIVALVRPVTG